MFGHWGIRVGIVIIFIIYIYLILEITQIQKNNWSCSFQEKVNIVKCVGCRMAHDDGRRPIAKSPECLRWSKKGQSNCVCK